MEYSKKKKSNLMWKIVVFQFLQTVPLPSITKNIYSYHLLIMQL